uniref:Uncharacterized protein n=1 Tax=Arundo donax TaxID=35708 RepID=A0A0A9AQN7_ARUDO
MERGNAIAGGCFPSNKEFYLSREELSSSQDSTDFLHRMHECPFHRA